VRVEHSYRFAIGRACQKFGKTPNVVVVVVVVVVNVVVVVFVVVVVAAAAAAVPQRHFRDVRGTPARITDIRLSRMTPPSATTSCR